MHKVPNSVSIFHSFKQQMKSLMPLNVPLLKANVNKVLTKSRGVATASKRESRERVQSPKERD